MDKLEEKTDFCRAFGTHWQYLLADFCNLRSYKKSSINIRDK